MHRNHDWVGRWRHTIYSGYFTLESNSHPFFLAFLPDTWLFGAMEITPIFCVYYALPSTLPPFKAYSTVMELFLPNANLVISVLWLKSPVVEMLWKYFPNQHLPTPSVHSVPHQHTLALCSHCATPSMVCRIRHALSHPHASEQAVTSACKVPFFLFGPRLPSQWLPLF